MHRPEPQNALKLINNRGHARAGGDNYIVWTGVNMFFYFSLGKMISLCHQSAGFAGFGVGIPDKGAESINQFILDWPVEPPAGNPVGINDLLFAVRRLEGLIDADNILSELFKMFFHQKKI